MIILCKQLCHRLDKHSKKRVTVWPFHHTDPQSPIGLYEYSPLQVTVSFSFIWYSTPTCMSLDNVTLLISMGLGLKAAAPSKDNCGTDIYIKPECSLQKKCVEFLRASMCLYQCLCVHVHLAGLWYPPGLVVQAGRVSLSDPVDAPAPGQHGLQRLSDWPTVSLLVLQQDKPALFNRYRVPLAATGGKHMFLSF